MGGDSDASRVQRITIGSHSVAVIRWWFAGESFIAAAQLDYFPKMSPPPRKPLPWYFWIIAGALVLPLAAPRLLFLLYIAIVMIAEMPLLATQPALRKSPMPSEKRQLLRHFLATLAYRGSNILRGMCAEAAAFRPAETVRTPLEILNHINGVLTYAHACFVPYDSTRPPPADWAAEVQRFFGILRALDESLQGETPLINASEEQLLQGPLADAMLHLGQIGIFRRMAGSPVAAENYLLAKITAGAIQEVS